MKRLWSIILCLCFLSGCSQTDERTDGQIFFVDAQLNRLIPYEREIDDGDAEVMAKSALELIINGDDNNDNIRAIVPDNVGCLSVSVKDNVAYVDIDSQIKADMPCSRDIEKLFIYQIVNTLTGIKGIRFVRFTVDGAVQKHFLGFYDMREVYSRRYPE